MTKNSSFNLKDRKYKNFKFKVNFIRILEILLKLIKFFAKVIASSIILFCIANFIPEIREKMPTFFNIVDIILESFDNMLKSSALISKWF